MILGKSIPKYGIFRVLIQLKNYAKIVVFLVKDRGDIVSTNQKLYFTLIGAKIRYYRRISHLSQEELAKRVGISLSTLRRIEQGTYNQSTPLVTLMDIADGLNMDVQEFLVVSDLEKRLSGWK
jgi:DNA-binding XRE family transcriptional regulator